MSSSSWRLRFRYVEYQFEALRRCPRTEYYLDKYLQSLPRDLDETYERMLGWADEDYTYGARRILALLCYSYRPLSIAELADAYAVNIEKLQLNPGNRLLDFDGIKIMCKGFVEFSVSSTPINEERASMNAWLSHPSVQEYLMSDYIWPQNGRTDPLRVENGHTLLSKVCLTYLLKMSPEEVNQNESTTDWPLARYAAQYWYHHYERAGDMRSHVDPLILKLFKDTRGSFINWIKFWDADEKAGGTGETLATPARAATPVYVASFLGLHWLLEYLLAGEKGENCGTATLVNEESGCLGNALQAASFNGHEAVVHTLLQKGAHVDQQGGRFGNALQAASGEYVNSLLAASYNGHLEVFRMLLNSGADTSAQLSGIGNALQVASWRGHTELVKIMLEKGADINAIGGRFGNALQAASLKGHERTVRLLLEKGADTNIQYGKLGNALQAASWRGHQNVVQMLLDSGARVNTLHGQYGSALQAASLKGHGDVVRLLLGKGADPNLCGGEHGSALIAASHNGHEKIVQMLINRGADVNSQADSSNAFAAALSRGHQVVMQLLIAAGAME
ncbi:hypothetical protein N7462_008251 [Penicillium macrosclerotiorum]|uniref:uncharacterized protein n=1 Tax=Penicillium macrosclerotiorum TaxID=303699 RepID=UPI002546F7E6|nr:uncharacterized protein N7462_008251 [Penicillium macrosclerotiorum]KAJ5675354.1 hypothetical protein N7462_008251 [Penicillium macrosclerotiorum]